MDPRLYDQDRLSPSRRRRPAPKPAMSRQPVPAAYIPPAAVSEYTVTRDTAGELRCSCPEFAMCVVLYDGGSCGHTRRVQLALDEQARKERGNA